ncbi:MAG: hypothetical protein KGR26_05565, partial [Cyanobacteria bacterium REEB65]|nr:hypothetical protein [Cyanobacteria bacterium REEB65]
AGEPALRSTLDGKEPPAGHARDLPTERLQLLYRTIWLARQLDERFKQLQRQGEIPFYLPCTGHEAIGAAIAQVLAPGDWLFPGFRDLAAVVGRGVPLERIVHQVFGTGEASSQGRVLPVYQIHREHHVASSSAGGAAHLGHAVGVGWAAHLRHETTVALASFGEGAVASGEFHAALNFAGVFAAQVVFVCQNAAPVASPTSLGAIAPLAAGYGIASERVDGADVLGAVQALEVAVDRAREGKGSTLVEVVIAPGADSEGQLRREFQLRGLQPAFDAAGLAAEISAAIAQARQAPPPDPATMFTDVFAHGSPEL